MASAGANSLRTLARPTIPLASRIQPIFLSVASFSTTNGLSLPAAAKNRKDAPKPGKKNFKKKSQIQAVKKPNPGERKAFRKRIQLSNNGALAVEGLDTLAADSMRDPANSGKVFALSDALVDQLRALEAFKTTQQWNLFRKPHVLLRKETVEVMKQLDEAATKKELKQYVLTGTKLSGKSMMLLQALGHALMNNWVVIHVPEGKSITSYQRFQRQQSELTLNLQAKILPMETPNTPQSPIPNQSNSSNQHTLSSWCKPSTKRTSLFCNL